jgi:hypothetical protein
VYESRVKPEEIESIVADMCAWRIGRVADACVNSIEPLEEAFGEGLLGALLRISEDPALFTDIGQAIEAAITLYVKICRFARFDEIKTDVYEILSRHFSVTDERICITIERLIAKIYISQTPARPDHSRDIKMCAQFGLDFNE